MFRPLRVLGLALAASSALTTGVLAKPEQQALTRVAQTPLSQYVRGFNIFGADERGNRLFLATAHNGVVLVFNLKTGVLLTTLHDVADPHMLAFVRSRNEIWVSDSKGSCVTVLSGKDYRVLRKIALETNPTVGFYDERDEVFYIQEAGMNSGMASSVIDVIPAKATAPTLKIRIDDKNLEGMVVDHQRNRLYVNNREHAQIAVVDLATGKVVDTWTIPGMGQNTPMAIDEASGRLFVAARKPAKLYIVDLDTGRATGSVDILPTSDTVTWDPIGKRVFLSGLEGIAIYKQRTADSLELVGETADPGVKHGFLVSKLGRYYAAAAKVGDTPAALHIYQVSKR